MLTIALPTGRVQEDAIVLLQELGLPTEKLRSPGRSLVISEESVRYILAKPMDVPLYAHHGVADLAFAGSDVLWETSASLVLLADTGMGRCRLVVAGPPEMADRFLAHESNIMDIRVATKYPRIADAHFSSRGVQVNILHLNGSIELASRLGLADCILDIVQSGIPQGKPSHVLEDVAPVSLHLVASARVPISVGPHRRPGETIPGERREEVMTRREDAPGDGNRLSLSLNPEPAPSTCPAGSSATCWNSSPIMEGGHSP
jgi:ATP phosphoribosyltransferase